MEVTKVLRDAIEAYKGGETEAFTTIYNESCGYIRTCINNVVSNYDNKDDMADDIMQETYLGISKDIGKLENPDSFFGWAAMIARRRSYDMIKKTGKYVLLPEEANFDDLPDGDNRIPEQIVQDAEKQRIVREAIDTELNENEKACVVGFYYNDMKKSEIAEELSMPENTVRTNLKRAKKKLAKVINVTLVVAVAAAIIFLLLNNSLWKKVEPKKDPISNEQKTTEPTSEQQTTSKKEEPTTSKKEEQTTKTEEPTTNKQQDKIVIERKEGAYETAIRTPSFKNVASYVVERDHSIDHGTQYSVRYIVYYDSEGKEVGKANYNYYGGLTGWRDTDYEYNEDGSVRRRRVREYSANGKLWSDKNVTEYEYDEKGALIKETDLSDGSWIEYTTDSKGNAIEEKHYTSAGELESIRENDSEGKCIKSSDYYKGECSEITFYEYNSYGDCIRKEYYTRDDGFKEVYDWWNCEYEYDSEGRKISYYPGREDYYTYAYYTKTESEEATEIKKDSDEGVALKVLVKEYAFDEMYVQMVRKYDASGKMISIDYYTEEGTFTGWADISYKYDDKGNVTEEIYKRYNANGELMEEYPYNTYEYKYDSKGNIKTKTHIEDHCVYEYDEEGKIVKKEYLVFAGEYAYEYDESGKVIYVGDSSIHDEWFYEYDSEGNVIKVHDEWNYIIKEYSYVIVE